MLKISHLRKSLVGLLIAISSITYAQQQDVVISDNTAGKVIDELIVCDGMKFRLNMMDSTLTVYIHKDKTQQEEIKLLKLNTAEYKKVVEDLKKINSISEEMIDHLKRKLFWAKLREALIILLAVAAVIVF